MEERGRERDRDGERGRERERWREMECERESERERGRERERRRMKTGESMCPWVVYLYEKWRACMCVSIYTQRRRGRVSERERKGEGGRESREQEPVVHQNEW